MSATNYLPGQEDDFLKRKIGRHPLPAGKRRVQFGTRIEQKTLDKLTQYAEVRKVPLGRALDEILLVIEIPEPTVFLETVRNR